MPARGELSTGGGAGVRKPPRKEPAGPLAGATRKGRFGVRSGRPMCELTKLEIRLDLERNKIAGGRRIGRKGGTLAEPAPGILGPFVADSRVKILRAG